VSVTKPFFRMVGVWAVLLVAVTLESQAALRTSSGSGKADGVAAKSTSRPVATPSASQQAISAVAPVPLPSTDDGVINMGRVEPVTELYPNGKIKIEREVGQDAKGNYVNQGSYRMYDSDGQVIKAGEFLSGKEQGKWTQRFAKDEGQLFSTGQENEFTGPFTSEATFLDGKLHGQWTIKDGSGQQVVEWSFDNGVRSGTWTWWHSNGQKRLEAIYVNGALSGDVQEWDRDGKSVTQNTYIDGKCLVKTTGWYTLGQKHFEGYHLRASGMPQPSYDWWSSKVTTAAPAPSGPDQKHGLWTAWYRNGNKQIEAQYDHDVPVGRFTWWYDNGQKEAEGEYEAGRKVGTWITWHPNGLKESVGEHKDGKLISKVMHWDADGKLVEGAAGARPQSQSQSQSQYRPQYPAQPQKPGSGSVQKAAAQGVLYR
jgi:antitoxin component YwqK of YwqJK toxin-antitoxin module